MQYKSYFVITRYKRYVDCDRFFGIVKRVAFVLILCFIAVEILIIAFFVLNAADGNIFTSTTDQSVKVIYMATS